MGAVSLGDYSNDEFIEGGTIYTVELVYPTGHRQMMRWHAREVDPKAEAVLTASMRSSRPGRPKPGRICL